jgi:multidrug resistance efflux pump
MSAPKRVPVPIKQRLQDLRLRVVPVLAFIAALGCLAVLWKHNLSAPTLVGQAEPFEANVSCYKPGMLAQLEVTRFQKVKSGDAVGQVLVTDPKILASSLAVIEAEIEALRAGLQPIASQQRTAMGYSELRLNWMRERAQLAIAKVNSQLAESEFLRMQELFKDKIVSQRVFDQAKAAQERSRNEVEELNRLVEEQGKAFTDMQVTNVIDLAKISDNPLRTAIAVQESKLRLTEAELSPIILRAPMDGMVSMVFHRSGEAINAGEPIATIAAFNPVRIVGYLRAPVMEQPRVGSRVEVRTRGPHREVGLASILQVGTQVEAVTPALLGPVKFANLELGLPISISLPPDLKIMPGELVDLTILPKIE